MFRKENVRFYQWHELRSLHFQPPKVPQTFGANSLILVLSTKIAHVAVPLQSALSLRSSAFSRAFHGKVAHLMRWGNFATPANNEASCSSFWRSSFWPWTICEKTSANSCTCIFSFPITASVIIEADAVEIVHPSPSNAMSVITPSSTLTDNSITSPQVGLWSSSFSTPSNLPWWWGDLRIGRARPGARPVLRPGGAGWCR